MAPTHKKSSVFGPTLSPASAAEVTLAVEEQIIEELPALVKKEVAKKVVKARTKPKSEAKVKSKIKSEPGLVPEPKPKPKPKRKKKVVEVPEPEPTIIETIAEPVSPNAVLEHSAAPVLDLGLPEENPLARVDAEIERVVDRLLVAERELDRFRHIYIALSGDRWPGRRWYRRLMNYLQELLLPSPLRQARRIYRRFVREYEREVATLGGVLIRLEKRYAARGGLSTDRLVGRLDRLAAEAVTVARHDLEIFATEGERIASRRLEFVNDVNSLLEQIEQAFSVIDGEELIEE